MQLRNAKNIPSLFHKRISIRRDLSVSCWCHCLNLFPSFSCFGLFFRHTSQILYVALLFILTVPTFNIRILLSALYRIEFLYNHEYLLKIYAKNSFIVIDTEVVEVFNGSCAVLLLMLPCTRFLYYIVLELWHHRFKKRHLYLHCKMLF
jgi:hypothetical protein